MAESEGFIKQLLARRVPQIVGLYIAATWMTVEIGEWVTGQIGIPGSIVFYVFVAMAALLPAVAVLAWNHGAPGRDEWKTSEKWIVSGNAVMALVLLFVVIEISPMGTTAEAQDATVERVLIDETGQEQVFQVAREGFHKQISTSFWPMLGPDGTESPAWESYVIPWLISLHLNRDPLLSTESAYSLNYIQALREAGFERAIGEPLSLALQIAREANTEFLIRGEFERSDSGYRLTARVYSAETGRQIAEHLADGNDLVQAVDELNEAIRGSLIGDLDTDPESFVRIALAEAATDQPGALKALSDAMQAWLLDNDYPETITQLEYSLELDPEFAQAYFWLHAIYRLSGDLTASAEAIQNALRFDYKLDTHTLFILRANGYAIEGDMDKAVRVLDMWTQVHPESEMAWITLAQNLLFQGNTENARTALLEAQQIDPDNSTIFRLLAQTEELAGNLDLATEQMEAYLADQPDDQAGWVSLGNMHLRHGQFDQAKEAYEYAQFIGSGSFAAELGLIRVETFGGDPGQAARLLDQVLAENPIGTEFAQLIFDKTLLLTNVGKPQQALDLLNEHDAAISAALPPVVYALEVTAYKADLHRKLEQAKTGLELLREQVDRTTDPVKSFLELSQLGLLESMGRLEQAQQLFEDKNAFFETFDFPGRETLLLQAEARVLAMQGRLDEASDNLRLAFEQSQKTSLRSNLAFMNQLQLMLADYLFKAGQLTAAGEAAQHLLQSFPNHAEGQLLQARIAIESGRPEQAVNILNGLLQQWDEAETDYPLFQQARALSESLR